MMKRRFLALALLAIGLFLLLSAVSAEDIAADTNTNPDNPLDAIENSNDTYQDSDSDASDATGNVTSEDSSKVPSKFTS